MLFSSPFGLRTRPTFHPNARGQCRSECFKICFGNSKSLLLIFEIQHVMHIIRIVISKRIFWYTYCHNNSQEISRKSSANVVMSVKPRTQLRVLLIYEQDQRSSPTHEANAAMNVSKCVLVIQKVCYKFSKFSM